MDDLVQWLREQLDDDERIARAASGATVEGEPGSWRPSPHGDEWEPLRGEDGDEELLVALRPGLPRPPEVMTGYWGAVFSHRPDDAEPGTESPMTSFEHAARHDPARVLREIEAKRRIVAMYEEAKAAVDSYTEPSNRLIAAASRNSLASAVKALALPYSDRPGYRDDWRP